MNLTNWLEIIIYLTIFASFMLVWYWQGQQGKINRLQIDINKFNNKRLIELEKRLK